ncbi:MAG: bacillithiol biosynthesis BshC, partial [bacterium]
ETGYKRMKSGVDENLSRFIDNSLKFDSSLEAFGEQIKGKIEFSLKQLEGKVFSAHKKKSKETRERIYRLWNTLFTNRNLQERTLNISYFISKYGFDVIKFIYDQLDSEENAHQLIYLSEMEKK